ncbi:MAG: asparagine synthase-related protein, partial [Blastocatellia bacterium]
MAVNFQPSKPFNDRLRDLQYRDARFTKIPRALRFNDRISMRSSTELREPFLDHRLFELALRQPPERKLNGEQNKLMLRQIVREMLPVNVVEAPKRPVQTPQREW